MMFKAPKWRGPEDVSQFIRDQDWELREESISAPRTSSQGWVITARPPQGDRDAETVEFTRSGPTQCEIVLRRWKKRAPQVSVEEKPATQGWRRPKAEAEAVAAAADKAMEGAEAAETGADAAHRDQRRKTEVPTKGPGDTDIWDLHGDGDCGFRCLGAIQATFAGKSKAEIEGKIGTLSKTMRTKVFTQLKLDQSWKENWTQANDDDAQTAGGEVPQGADAWLEAIKTRPKIWLEWRMLQAAATALKRTIVIFEQVDGSWVQRARFKPAVPLEVNDEVVPLLLDTWGSPLRHFKTCVRGAEGFPNAWAKTKELPTWSGKGGAGSPEADEDSQEGFHDAFEELEVAHEEPRTPSEGAVENWWPGLGGPEDELEQGHPFADWRSGFSLRPLGADWGPGPFLRPLDDDGLEAPPR